MLAALRSAGQNNPPVRSIEGNEDDYNGLIGAGIVQSEGAQRYVAQT
ncbi:MAG: hypothetical protein JWP35_176 [Caulobacter sp.]|nr:hypothetical protein [Caulobacter sp.]